MVINNSVQVSENLGILKSVEVKNGMGPKDIFPTPRFRQKKGLEYPNLRK